MPSAVNYNGQSLVLLTSTTITAAVSGIVAGTTTRVPLLQGANYLTVLSKFTYGSGGTTAKFWVQTSLDGGVTWFDIVNHAYTTATASKVSSVTSYIAPASQGFAPSDAALADNTIIQGVIGDRFRVKYTTTGTYGGGTTIAIYAIAKG
jgi:hypothetical protein